ncbi:MAG: methyltransferase domain-containing protein [Verrucomicrobiae bacterium]|nr:methyltransferase domain-containing protein [Verrucomicrobiae bacterium]
METSPQIPRGARLHLGCGGQPLPGYVNIDTQPSDRQPRPKADIFTDFTRLSLSAGHVSEIRLHHVFEHFRKGEAAALLARFNEWLQPDGALCVEVPDFGDTSLYYLLTGDLRAIRHLAGSQEASWATHHELWDARQLRRALDLFGFGRIALRRNRAWFRRSRRKWWCNLTALARKERSLEPEEARRAAEAFFEPYLVNREIELSAWLGHFDAMMGRGRGP